MTQQPVHSSQEDRAEVIAKLYADGKLFTTLASTDSAPNLEPLWGNWLFRKSVVFQVGEPGISKTTFDYSFASCLLHNKPFLGINGIKPNVNTLLYMDLESSDSLIKARRSLLEIPDNDRFIKCNIPNVMLKDAEPYIDQLVEEMKAKGQPINIMFVDPVRAAFRMRDENDNAEASVQMMYVRYLSQKWDCAIVLVHHSSKAEMKGTRKGSGAYARAALADIIWDFEKMLDEDGEEFDSDLFKFYIPKSRFIQDDFCICIRKQEGFFSVEDFPPKYKIKAAGMRIYTLQQALNAIMMDGKTRGSQEMLDALEKIGEGTSRMSLHKAITALIQLGAMKRAGYGRYVHT